MLLTADPSIHNILLVYVIRAIHLAFFPAKMNVAHAIIGE
jgi:hypothetical protein